MKPEQIFKEALYKLEKEVVELIITLKLEKDTHLPDLLTKIRILPGVAVVSQEEKTQEEFESDRVQISIKYLPIKNDVSFHISKMCKTIKKLPGVKIIIVDIYNNRIVTSGGKKLIF